MTVYVLTHAEVGVLAVFAYAKDAGTYLEQKGVDLETDPDYKLEEMEVLTFN